MRRSGTFAHLVLALDKSDVIVYIESGRAMPTSIVGRSLRCRHSRLRVDQRQPIAQT